MKKPPLIIIAGPTASGKTALSVKLAEKIRGSVISADSMQVYRYMDIGSAKITPEEMRGIPHYLIDERLPSEEFNIVRFQELAKRHMAEIYAQGRIPILAGGTGFYIQSVLYDIDFSKEPSSGFVRKELLRLAETEGNGALHQRLRAVDPASASAIHPNNVKRVIRALEFYGQNGYPISKHNEEERKKESPYRFAYFVISDDRARLYGRIDRRVDDMMERGLLEEVRRLKEMGCHKGMASMQGLGYKEMLSFLDGEISLEEAVYILKRDTRHFAKRQITWFKREKDAVWLDRGQFGSRDGAILRQMLSVLKEKGIVYES